jgi:hypothetical protein
MLIAEVALKINKGIRFVIVCKTTEEFWLLSNV